MTIRNRVDTNRPLRPLYVAAVRDLRTWPRTGLEIPESSSAQALRPGTVPPSGARSAL